MTSIDHVEDDVYLTKVNNLIFERMQVDLHHTMALTYFVSIMSSFLRRKLDLLAV